MVILTLEQLVDYAKDKNRICPKPQIWNELWEKLKDKKRLGYGWNPPLPLILAAWDETSNKEKQERFIQHLEWADCHKQLEEVSLLLTGLSEESWFHEYE